MVDKTLGITPADAGKTDCDRQGRRDCQDHPRGCGENQQQEPAPELGGGSPPRMRGKHAAFMNELQSNGITPADAGKTAFISSNTRTILDHPRGCGENLHVLIIAYIVAGSPPRMRGKRKEGRGQPPDGGITPADAGKT